MRRALLGSIWLLSACSIKFGPGSFSSALAPELSGESRSHEFVRVRGLNNIQRTMRLLSTSTKKQKNKVRVLFYGQSITQSAWSREVAEKLRERYPHAQLEIDNRAIGGFAADLLVKTAETDLYSYYPDLVIFHVYGAHDRYEDIVRRLRERTTAEIVLQTDHVVKSEDLSEPTDPKQLSPRPEIWDAFMNNAFIPEVAERYQTELCDVRNAWKQHLRQRAELPGALLKDGLHLNGRGDALMADYVSQCLRTSGEPVNSPAEAWVQTTQLAGASQWQTGRLTFEFDGNRVDALLSPGESSEVNARIDGRAPSEWTDLYAFSRAKSARTGDWPPLLELSAEAPLLLETFTIDVTPVREGDELSYSFSVHGSKTGADGSGNSRERFVSNSKRLVIDPDDWNVQYAFQLAGHQVPDKFSIEVRVEPRFTNSFHGWAGDEETGQERSVTIAQGLPNTHHTLELTGSDWAVSHVRALRIYRPPLARH